ncbi:hypothetical protein AOQ84DRAFT_433683 [Glonium stellatum]|uniref:Utp8 beta-propeller domain-containing protein n=1 Tax=Glonium stellatum TaxID=574774 RepID=A0A8E2ES91_9PEZI|nr:hypothetical protein AOQ84DRAFT_433683 [Glonium stellatum]
MSSSREIETPHTLASLPRPIDSANGRTLGAAVYSLSGSKKRKRSEIAVGIDGEGISIYSIQAPELVTSYALPPQTYFTTPPCSVYRKGSKNRPTQRFTYASVTQSISGTKPQIVCFAEEVKKKSAHNPEKYSFAVREKASKVVSIDIVPLSDALKNDRTSHDVVVILEDGEINCISADLSTARWTAYLPTLASTRNTIQDEHGFLIEYASLTNGSAVRRGLLKGREDIVAILDPSTDEKSDLLEATPILCVVAQSLQPNTAVNDGRNLHIFSLLPRSSNAITTHRPHVQHLLTWALPQPSTSVPRLSLKPSYSLHAMSGTLHQLLDGAIFSYDLSGTVPRISSELKPSKDLLQSFIRISPTLIFGISATSCGLFDTKYNSVQSIVPLTAYTSPLPDSKKRKYSSSAEKSESSLGHFDVLAFFSDIGLAVGLSNQELVGIQIGVNTRLHRSGSSRESLLIDSIGKGIRSKRVKPEQRGDGSLPMPISRCIVNPIYETDKKWLEQIARLDECVENDDVLNFEKLFAAEIGVSLEVKDIKERRHPQKSHGKTSQKFVNGTQGEKLANGVDMEEAELIIEDGDTEVAEETSDELSLSQWQLPEVIPDSVRLSHRHKALYALGKIFTWTASSSGARTMNSTRDERSSIAIKFFPPNVFQWLLLIGHVTSALIERALRDTASHEANQTVSVLGGDIATAIFNFDPEMRILHAVLNQSSFFPISEIVQSIKLLIRSLDNSPQPKTSMLLTNGASSVDDENMEHIESEIEAASQDLDLALSTLHDGLIIRSQTLRPALTRLHSFPASLITSTLRTCLTHHEIIFLIHLLRLELNDGGWASRYFFDSGHSIPDAGAGDPSDRAIVIIVSLLSCALDAVGTVGWLAAANSVNSVDSTEDVLHSLRLETSAALEGIWEAGFMKGLLSDFLRYSRKSAEGQHKPDNRKMRAQGKPELVHSWQGKDTQTVEQSMLPLGVSELMGIERKKVGIGGEIKKRSAREMGIMISKRVPKYSLERIVI